MFRPTDVHKIFSNFKKRRGERGSIKQSCRQPVERGIPLGFVASQRGVNGATRSSPPRHAHGFIWELRLEPAPTAALPWM